MDSELKKLYGRLKGIKEVMFTQNYVQKEIGDDYNSIVDKISKIVSEDLTSFCLPNNFYYRSASDELMCTSDTIKPKLLQLLSYLEYGYNVIDSVVEIGSIYNSIQDQELKSRCSDILTSRENFDRVINQATLVLEDRIRNRSKLDRALIGVNLVNKALNADVSKSALKISDNQEEHEGICHICRGIMLAFRNPTHHYITDTYSREDALKFCAFIDNLLQLIEKAKITSTT